MTFFKSITYLFIVLTLCVGSSYGNEESTTTSPTAQVDTSPWPNDFIGRLKFGFTREWDNGGRSLTASIFSELTDLRLFNHKFGDNGPSIGMEIKREIYDNADLSESYTVVDFFRIPLSFPIFTTGDIPLAAGLSTRLDLSANVNLNSMHIKQVLPKDIDKLPAPKDLEKKAVDILLKEAKKEGVDLLRYYDIGDEKNKTLWKKFKELFGWNSQNTQQRARWTKVWQLLTNPLHIPWTKKSIIKKEVGTINSYQVEGTVQLDASVGWSLINIPDRLVLKAGIGATTYLKGSYRISILKEKENSAIVKLTRVFGTGLEAYLGSSYQMVPFKGFLIFDKPIGKIKTTLIPFHLSTHRYKLQSFDVAYRYDLTNPLALKAYTRAVKGLFRKSGRLSHMPDTGVTKAYTRKKITYGRSNRNRLKLFLIYQSSHGSGKSINSALIKTQKDEHHIFSSETYSEKSWDTLWAAREFSRLSMQTVIDEDKFKNDGRGVFIQFNGRIRDTRTSAKEMLRYTNQIEQMLGDENIFPDVQLRGPPRKCKQKRKKEVCKKGRKIKYRGSSFSYSFNFNADHLYSFMNYPKKKRWALLEKIFGIKEGRWKSQWRRFLYGAQVAPLSALNIPLALARAHIKIGGKIYRARRIYNNWRLLTNSKTSEDITKYMAAIFMTQHFPIESFKLFIAASAKHDFTYVLNANAARFFGVISKVGHVRTHIELLLEDMARLIDFETNRYNESIDYIGQIKGFSVSYPNKDTVHINFNLSHTPQFIYFQIDKSSSWSRYKKLGNMVLHNKGLFQQGPNRIVIKRDEKKGWKKLFSKYFFQDFFITFKAAIKRPHLKSWTKAYAKRFRPPPQENKKQKIRSKK